MSRRIAFLILLVLSLVPVSPAAAQGTARKADPKKSEKPAAASMKGCIDQQNGAYVLIDERTRNLIADLEADGFPTEGFAKHVGHKVTIRGTSNQGGERPLFRVRNIETISDSCEPQAQQ